ncbi:MAG TPA: HAMP domain-containing sensor histidine kinase [Vicinamibacterales bacterium]|jgi:signal transduction histidine kinase|nr:HAMP domain-containing sensor histidine kinase [Vicinamibacterales bacterium]
MSRWYQSLYWKIAAAFLASLALVLIVNGVLFIFVVEQSGPTLPGQPPERFAQTVALDLAQALAQDSTFDVARFVHEQYGKDAHPFFVMMTDGKFISNGGPFPESLILEARTRLRRGVDYQRPDWGARYDRYRRGGSRGGGPEGAPPPAPNLTDPPPGFTGAAPAFRGRPMPIVVNNQVVGVVAVLPRAPFWFLLSRYAPTLGAVASASLVLGGALAAFIVFGPARKRLRAVEDTARRLGAGDLSARVPTRGGDEVAAVATAFNAMADELSTRAAALAESDRVRRQLLADVSHELTTPVTAMRGYLETLTMPEFDLDSDTRGRYLNIIGDETARLEHIIGDLLDLARLESGGGTVVIDDEVPVEQLFDRLKARHERDLNDANVVMHAVIEPGADMVVGDRDRLEQALQNLAANALRYAPAGTAIELRSSKGPTHITLSVEDAGPGISLDHLPHVFDRFYKAEASRAIRSGPGQAGGSGLGLSIVKAIVERHGGRVTVASQPGRTVFSLQLPRREL